MSKSHPTLEADTYRSPLSLPGDKVSVYVGDRSSEWLESRRTAAVEWHIWAGVGPVKHFLQIYVRKFRPLPKRADFRQKVPGTGRLLALGAGPVPPNARRSVRIMPSGTPIPGSRRRARAPSGVLDIVAHRLGLGLDAVHAVLDQVANADEADHPFAVHDRQVADPP